MTEFTLRPIGYVRSSRSEMLDDGWDAENVHVELDPNEVRPDSTLGLEEFSHIEVIFLFDRVDPDAVCRGARHPRNREDWPMTGILAHRAKDRPNRIGLTVCRLVSVDGLRIDVSGLDAIDGTPVLDVKPYMLAFAARGDVKEPEWAEVLAGEYW